MDYVYVCRNGENEELRYSLRSLEKNMPSGNVWLVGYRPDWFRGNFIPLPDSSSKFENIKKCIFKITDTKEISENFILMNDDFFAFNKIKNIPVLHGGLLRNKIIRYKELKMSSKYIKLLEMTEKDLLRYGINDPIDYEIHMPMPMNKNILRETIGLAYFPRSGYGNIAQIGGDIVKDVKIYSNNVGYKLDKKNLPDFISTEDRAFIKLKPMLQSLFPDPSIFEGKTNWNTEE